MTILIQISGAVAGAVAGFFISRKISAVFGGGCPILCNPKISVPYFAFLGFLLVSELVK